MSALPLNTNDAVALVDDRLGLDVVLVADLADDLLEQVLDRHQARGAAVLVDDDRALNLLALELLQQLGDTLGLGHEVRRPQQRRDRRARRPRPSAGSGPSRTRSRAMLSSVSW